MLKLSPLSAVCHGPAAIAYAKLSDGSYLINGCTVTGFSNSEEDGMLMTLGCDSLYSPYS
jgi:putative intracellular protease/amidase